MGEQHLYTSTNQVRERQQLRAIRACMVLLVALSCSYIGSIPVAESFAVGRSSLTVARENLNSRADKVKISFRVSSSSSSISTTGDEAYYSPSFVQYGERSLQQQQQKVTLTRFLSHEVQEKPEVGLIFFSKDCCFYTVHHSNVTTQLCSS
jgi:hypothetical protein